MNPEKQLSPEEENIRLSILESLNVMDTDPEKFFDEITQIASAICCTPIALVSLVDDKRQWFKSKVGLEAPETPREISFCQHAIQQEDVFEVENALEDDRFKENPLVLSDPNIRFYAGAPLETSEGYNIGTLCVIDREPKKLTSNQIESLEALAQSVINQLELRKTNIRLEDEKELTETALESSLAGYWDWNMLTNEEYLSPRFKEMFGYADDEMENSPEAWQKIAFPEDLPGMFEAFNKHVESKGQVPFKSVVRYNHKDGSVVWVRCNGKVVKWSEDGAPLRAIGCHVDITEERESELSVQKEKDFLSEISRIQSSVNYNSPPNEIFNQLLDTLLKGLESEYGFIGEIKDDGTQKYLKTHAITNIAWTDDLDKFYKENAPKGLEFKNLETLFGQTIKTGEPVIANDPYTDKRRGGLPDGHPHMGAYLGVPIKNYSGLIGMIGIANKKGGYSDDDIRFIQPFLAACSSLVTGYNSFAEWKRSERIVEFKSEFLAQMSHEIRTPLNGIVGSLDAYAKLEDQSKKNDLYEIMKESSRDLLNIVNDVLNLSKLEANKIELNPVGCNIHSIVKNTAELFKVKAEEKGSVIDFAVSENVPKYVKVDDIRLKQVLNNLVSNAVKFTENGSVNINLDLVQGNQLSFSIIDTGTGIKSHDIDKIFLRYEQTEDFGHRRRMAGARGTGLGLTISKMLVELMGGDKIHVESVYGKGSTFSFNIDFESVNDVEYIQAKNIKDKKVSGKLDKNLNVLVVEDIKANQVVAKIMLESIGISVDIANNGEEALFMYADNPDKYDLIFMDVQMPVMDGVTATLELKRVYGDKMCPIVGLSANAMEGDIQKYKTIGMDGYIPKPITKDAVIQEIMLRG